MENEKRLQMYKKVVVEKSFCKVESQESCEGEVSKA